MTATATITSTKLAGRRRALSLYFSAPIGTGLLTLPSELILQILELVIRDSRETAFDLAVVSKRISQLIDIILYTSVVLPTSHAISLFFRTTHIRPSSFFANHVKHLSVTWRGMLHSHVEDKLSRIIYACPCMRTLVVPPTLSPFSVPRQVQKSHSIPSPLEMVFGSYVDLRPKPVLSFYLPAGASPKPAPATSLDPTIAKSVTHLRFCEPGEQFHSPYSVIESFGQLPNLTHLQLSRRARANEDNDHAFVDDVRALLRDRGHSLKMLAISIFSPSPLDHDVVNSSIWGMLSDIARDDQRVVVLEGQHEAWAKETNRSQFWADAEKARVSV